MSPRPRCADCGARMTYDGDPASPFLMLRWECPSCWGRTPRARKDARLGDDPRRSGTARRRGAAREKEEVGS